MQLIQGTLDGALADLIATGATFDPAAVFVGVGTAIVPAGLNTTLDAITQCTGAMATRKPITAWSDVMHLQNQCSAVEGPLMTFTPASAAEDQSVAVWYLADAATDGNLLAYGLVNPPVPLVDQFSSWNIVLRLCLDPTGTWSAEITWNG